MDADRREETSEEATYQVVLDGLRDPRQAARAGTRKLADAPSRPYQNLNIIGARTLPGAPPTREQRFPSFGKAPEALKARFGQILAHFWV